MVGPNGLSSAIGRNLTNSIRLRFGPCGMGIHSFIMPNQIVHDHPNAIIKKRIRFLSSRESRFQLIEPVIYFFLNRCQ